MSEIIGTPLAIITTILAIALVVAAIIMPLVVILIDNRLAKLVKIQNDSMLALKSMESMMRNGR